MKLSLLGVPFSGVGDVLAALELAGIDAACIGDRGIEFGLGGSDPEPLDFPDGEGVLIYLTRHPLALISELAAESGCSMVEAAALWERQLRFHAAELQRGAVWHHVVLLDSKEASDWAALADFIGEGEAAQQVVAVLKEVGEQLPSPALGGEREYLNGVQLDLWKTVQAKQSPEGELSGGAADALVCVAKRRGQEVAGSRRLADDNGRRFVIESNVIKAANRQSAAVRKLEGLLADAEQASRHLQGSSRWKLGNALTLRFGERALRYSPLAEVFNKWRQWREGQGALPPEGDFARSGSLQAGAALALLSPSVEVVVCVHNAAEDVARCLASLRDHSGALLRRIILVNDGSDAATCAVLDAFVTECAIPVRRIDRHEAGGYTVAANAGLAVSMADYVVMVNSDTVVPPGWVERVLACGQSDPKIGVIGAVSNAASWQSVPRRRGESGDWLVNALPVGWDAARFAMSYASARPPSYPRVDLLNGFFFAIKRPVLQAVGRFDEEAFPRGYGEENDFCFRVVDAGFELAVADDLYVWHAKSKSYSHARREGLADAAGKVLYQRYGKRLQEVQERLAEVPGLAEARATASELCSREDPPMRCLYLMPFRGVGGGTHSVVQEAEALRARGVCVQLGILQKDLSFYRERYPQVSSQLFFAQDGASSLIDVAGHFDVVIGTSASTIALLGDISHLHPQIVPAYYIQDYEPRFYSEGSPQWVEARDSYQRIPEMLCFAKTEWICETVQAAHGIAVAKVDPSLDHSVYRPEAGERCSGEQRVVCAMVRPDSPHRSPEKTLEVLVALAAAEDLNLRVLAFGCAQDDGFFDGRSTAGVELQGQLSREQVAAVLASSDLFLDLSTYQAFGRTGLEAMACGCAVVLPSEGGVGEYAGDGENALFLDDLAATVVVERVRALIQDEGQLASMRKVGLATAAEYSVGKAAASVEAMFSERLENGGNEISRRPGVVRFP